MSLTADNPIHRTIRQTHALREPADALIPRLDVGHHFFTENVANTVFHVFRPIPICVLRRIHFGLRYPLVPEFCQAWSRADKPRETLEINAFDVTTRIPALTVMN